MRFAPISAAPVCFAPRTARPGSVHSDFEFLARRAGDPVTGLLQLDRVVERLRVGDVVVAGQDRLLLRLASQASLRSALGFVVVLGQEDRRRFVVDHVAHVSSINHDEGIIPSFSQMVNALERSRVVCRELRRPEGPSCLACTSAGLLREQRPPDGCRLPDPRSCGLCGTR